MHLVLLGPAGAFEMLIRYGQRFLIDIWWRQIRPREEIRERYGIRGSAFGDCFISWCCGPCSLTQERREIELEERNFPSE